MTKQKKYPLFIIYKPTDKTNLGRSNKYNSGRWTPEENIKYFNFLRIYKRKWSLISKEMKTRSPNQIRSHTQKIIAKLMRRLRLSNNKLNEIRNKKVSLLQYIENNPYLKKRFTYEDMMILSNYQSYIPWKDIEKKRKYLKIKKYHSSKTIISSLTTSIQMNSLFKLQYNQEIECKYQLLKGSINEKMNKISKGLESYIYKQSNINFNKTNQNETVPSSQ